MLGLYGCMFCTPLRTPHDALQGLTSMRTEAHKAIRCLAEKTWLFKRKKNAWKKKKQKRSDINRKSTQMGKGLVGIGRDIHI
jgi:hypothetical protein